ncbi:hypothetical protein Bbelb_120810 [Branchiostoma belcheri]|nr:hypothetical protein Bbelb_120810 [Branchiostoma belcheri]
MFDGTVCSIEKCVRQNGVFDRENSDSTTGWTGQVLIQEPTCRSLVPFVPVRGLGKGSRRRLRKRKERRCGHLRGSKFNGKYTRLGAAALQKVPGRFEVLKERQPHNGVSSASLSAIRFVEDIAATRRFVSPSRVVSENLVGRSPGIKSVGLRASSLVFSGNLVGRSAGIKSGGLRESSGLVSGNLVGWSPRI